MVCEKWGTKKKTREFHLCSSPEASINSLVYVSLGFLHKFAHRVINAFAKLDFYQAQHSDSCFL